jgi:hypothetical protein
VHPQESALNMSEALRERLQATETRPGLHGNAPSSVMLEIIQLDAERFIAMLLLAIVRTLDCLICFLRWYDELSRTERAAYKELAAHELVIFHIDCRSEYSNNSIRGLHCTFKASFFRGI